MFLKRKNIYLTALLLGSFVIPAGAATITYNTFTHAGLDPINYTVTINDDTAGFFDISYGVTASSAYTVGNLTGFFFDMGPIDTSTLPDPDSSNPYSATNLGLTNESNPSGTSICGQAFGDVNNVTGGGGCNSKLQLGSTIIDGLDYKGFLFDVGLAWKVNDLSSGSIGSFMIADVGQSLSDWGAIGLRAQATGTGADGGNGSAKEFQLRANDQTPGTGGDNGNIPEPTSLMLLGVGLLGFFSVSRRKAKAA